MNEKMNVHPPPLAVRVSGPLACFTRPELKVERFSYPVPTPSAARGILESILWKPAIRWRIERIKVLRPIEFTSFRRNEVGTKATKPSPKVVKSGGEYATIAVEDRRQQRNTVALRDVAYLIEARIDMTDFAGPDDNKAKFVEMFQRRVAKGQCFTMPFLGCSEFVADFEPPRAEDQPIDDTRDLGIMLWDMRYVPQPPPAKEKGKKKSKAPKPRLAWRAGDKVVQGDAWPVFFAAKMNHGVIEIPATADDAEASIRAAHGLAGGGGYA